jgi:hypothetical protein
LLGTADLIEDRRKMIAQRVQFPSRSIVACCAALAAGGCARQVNLGDIGDGAASILWSATFETGDLSEWTGDGLGGSYLNNDTIAPVASPAVAHRGRYGGMVTFTTTTVGTPSVNYLFRNQPSPPAAYYSAWFYIPSSFTVKSWLSLSHFTASGTNDGNNLIPIWDINLYPRADGSLIAHLFNYGSRSNLEQTTPIPVPLATWVHFEVLFSKAPDATGEVAVWQDGTLILDARDVVTSATDWVQWDAGGSSDSVDPPTAIVYMDDAAISLTRLGTADWNLR